MQFIQTLATVAATLAAIYALCMAQKQLSQADAHKKWQNYNELNARYSEMLKDLHSEKNKAVPTPYFSDTQLWASRYFDLASEEFWLHKEQLLPKHTWECRIAPGIARNFRELHFLATAYETWKKSHERIHPADFVAEIEQIQHRLPECPLA